jgi:DnaJ-class molecular chaperone
MPLADLLGSMDEEAAEAANVAGSPLAELTVAERHLVLSADDPYGVLGVNAEATATEVKVAWREQAKATHPDVNPDDPLATSRMLALNQAYEVLRDDRLRYAYDWLVTSGERVG